MFYRTYLNYKICIKFKYYCILLLYGEKMLFFIQISTSCIWWSEILKSSDTFDICKFMKLKSSNVLKKAKAITGSTPVKEKKF